MSLEEAFDMKRPGEAHIVEITEGDATWNASTASALADALSKPPYMVAARAEGSHVFATTKDERNQDVFRAYAAGFVAALRIFII
jgi:hypothetical protein